MPETTWFPAGFQPGTYYALPQSPQLYKQIMMIAGYDRYVQIARCFRDEDLRADRQPEFTQLDLEMAFVEVDDIIGVIDGLVARMAKEILGLDLKLPLPRMTYDEAMERFGHDAPDLRFGMELIDLTDLASEAEFRVFRAVAESGGRVRGINAKGAAASYSRKGIDELTAYIQEDFNAKGLAWFKVDEDGKLASPIAKNFAPELLEKIAGRMEAESGDLLLIVADQFEVTCKALYALRKRLAAELKLYDPKGDELLLGGRVPDVCRKRGRGRRRLGRDAPSVHLAAPARYRSLGRRAGQVSRAGVRSGDQRLRGRRRHHPNPRSKAPVASVQAVGNRRGDGQGPIRVPVGRLQYGAPPHGGIALGIDRLVMIFGGLTNIRDCIAFPKTQRATDLMTGAPGEVDAKQLRELGLKNAR